MESVQSLKRAGLTAIRARAYVGINFLPQSRIAPHDVTQMSTICHKLTAARLAIDIFFNESKIDSFFASGVNLEAKL